MKNILLIVGLVCLSVCASAQQVARSLTATNGKKIGFYEYKPTDYNKSKKYPLIIFLHGIGERGNGTTNLPRVLNNATPRMIRAGNTMTFTNPKTGVKETFLVLTPQLDVQYGSWENFYVDEMLKYAKSNLSIDPNRVFLCGLSLGGGGVWKYATASLKNANQFAGIIPCCGTGEGTDFCNLTKAKTAVWAFHAMDDGTVGVGNTQYAQIKLGLCSPAATAKFTYYPSGGHGIWERAFDPGHGFQNPNVYEWMLGLSRNGSNNDNQGQDNNQGKPQVPNVVPVANAGGDQAITLPVNTVTLNGTGSKDTDGSIKKYAWTKVSGPASGSIASPSEATTKVTGLAVGTYVFQLTVTDDEGATASDKVTISVNAAVVVNLPPVANAGAAQVIVLPVNSVTLDGTGSKDSDGKIKKYAWSKVSGPASCSIVSPSDASTKVSGLTTGTYVFQLTVTDDDNATASNNVTVTVNAAVNIPPVANAGIAQVIVLPVNNVILDGTSSKDTDGKIKTYLWSKVSGPGAGNIASPNGATTKVTGLVVGAYVFKLTVTDDDGATASGTVAVTVNPAVVINQPPTANAGNAQTITLPANNVTLNGGGSKDTDGKIVTYAWSKISGPASGTIAAPSAASTQVTGLVAGAYIFNLTVTDNSGASASATVAITVKPAVVPNTPPVAKAGDDFSTSNTYAYLSGAGSYDLDGSIVTWVWKQLGGPNNATFLSGNTMFPTIDNLVKGTYTFRLTVTDNSGASTSDEVKVTVTPGKAPIANAGKDFNTANNYAYLSGGASYDPDGSITGWAWSQVSGPNTASILSADGMFPTVQNLVAGAYTFRLKVTDNSGQSATDDVVLTVKANTAKTATTNSGISTQALSQDVNAGSTKLNEIAKEPSIYPNPATNQITVTFNNDYVGNYKFVVYDVKGKIAAQYNYSKQVGQVQQQLDISKLPAGMYYLETIYEGSLKPVIKKFVKL